MSCLGPQGLLKCPLVISTTAQAQPYLVLAIRSLHSSERKSPRSSWGREHEHRTHLLPHVSIRLCNPIAAQLLWRKYEMTRVAEVGRTRENIETWPANNCELVGQLEQRVKTRQDTRKQNLWQCQQNVMIQLSLSQDQYIFVFLFHYFSFQKIHWHYIDY
jgi:hypothetical protein